jgi:hypothetical protein
LAQAIDDLYAQAVKGEKAISVYDTRLADIERQYEQLHLKPLKTELAQLQQAHDTEKQPLFMREKTWTQQKANERGELRSLERQISVKEFQDSGKYKQQAKDWIAKNEPQTVQEAQQGQEAIDKYKELLEKLQPQKQEQQKQVKVVRNKDRDIDY